MEIAQEQISSVPGQSFRLIEWDETLRQVSVIHPHGKKEVVQGRGGDWHRHALAELTWFSAGRGTQFLGDHVGAFTAPSLVLIGPEVSHFWQEESQTRGVAIQWDPSGALASVPELLEIEPLIMDAAYGLEFTGQSAMRAGLQMELLADKSGARRLAGFLEILQSLSEALPGERSRLSGHASSSGLTSRAHGIDRAVRFIATHFRNRITLSDVLDVAGMSRATFCRHFPVQTRKSFLEFLSSVRLEHARRELIETDKRVVDIAFSVGFGDVSSLNRHFLARFGLSPSEYRRNAADSHTATQCAIVTATQQDGVQHENQ
jgi:AraC-like DNA-binding protein